MRYEIIQLIGQDYALIANDRIILITPDKEEILTTLADKLETYEKK